MRILTGVAVRNGFPQQKVPEAVVREFLAGLKRRNYIALRLRHLFVVDGPVGMAQEAPRWLEAGRYEESRPVYAVKFQDVLADNLGKVRGNYDRRVRAFTD